MRFLIDTTGLSKELKHRYADTIELDTQRLIARLSEELKGYRCDVHGELLVVQISWGPNVHSGVIVGFRLEGCCYDFVEDVYRFYFQDHGQDEYMLSD